MRKRAKREGKSRGGDEGVKPILPRGVGRRGGLGRGRGRGKEVGVMRTIASWQGWREQRHGEGRDMGRGEGRGGEG